MPKMIVEVVRRQSVHAQWPEPENDTTAIMLKIAYLVQVAEISKHLTRV